jgi:hypothetical protein
MAWVSMASIPGEGGAFLFSGEYPAMVVSYCSWLGLPSEAAARRPGFMDQSFVNGEHLLDPAMNVIFSFRKERRFP